MQTIADLHIHSRFSRATSHELSIPNLEKWAKIKGVNLLGTSDFTHPLWLQEIKQYLEEQDTGILKTANGFPFILQTEISLMYTQGNKGRRVHIVILAPNLEIVEQINSYLGKKGRLDYDGRPIFGMPLPEVTEALKSISQDIEVIPAHIWTPWFGVLGSKSGFDSFEEAFEDQVKHIYALETGLSCYDEKTEVLTNNGWKKFPQVKKTNKICTLNIKNNKIEFQKPRKIFTYKHKGKMYRLKTKRVDLLVTPNHKLLISKCDFRKPPNFFLKEAEFLFNKSKRFKKDGIWIGKNIKYFTLPTVKIKHGSRHYKGFRVKKEKHIPIKPWLKFFGFWMAEGWTTKGKNGDYNVCLANSNTDLLFEMKKILESFGYSIYQGNNVIRVRDYQLFHYLKQFGKSYNKFIPLEIKSLSKELLEIFFEYYIKGDGHIYGRNRKGLSATTISTRLRDDLQEIALKMGISAYYKLHLKKGTPITSLPHAKLKSYRQSEDSWVIYFIRKNTHTVLPSIVKKYNYKESWVNYDGFVYCLEVPNHIIYIRRNGIPVWCGNSDPEMNWRLSILDKYTITSFSDLHSFWPWRLGREATIFDLPKLTYKNIIKAIRTKEGYKGTIEVNPAYGKYHFDGHRTCNFSCSPKEAIEKYHNICPICKKPLTIGVEHRVEELADRKKGYKPKEAVKFYTLLPLHEILSKLLNSAMSTKKVWAEYNKLIDKFKDEYNILLNVPVEDLRKITTDKIASAILKNRGEKIKVKPGFDGQYGEAIIETEKQETLV
ncbi:MAG: hypothetical protein IB618_02420 [Candidatus Pacearchaeota archaeon]|nr:MAG: hypothetical protein IB618_02420 [Candidatus Pacearchaeota archaeon]